jgi:hypothetical protein
MSDEDEYYYYSEDDEEEVSGVARLHCLSPNSHYDPLADCETNRCLALNHCSNLFLSFLLSKNATLKIKTTSGKC